MEDLVNKFKKIFIDVSSRDSDMAKRCQQVFPSDKIEYVTSRPFPEIQGELSANEFNNSKKYLYITSFKGSFFKRCPGARPGLTCCNYFVLNLGLQCDMNCSYCYLQSFINSPVLTVYSNIDQALDELTEMAKTGAKQRFRIGTGETIDSLSLDELTLYSKKLIGFFHKLPNWNLEFKTKSNKVDHFIDEPHAGNVIVSWSVNPQNIVDSEEHGTASLEERLIAAEKCAKKGFVVSFHIDPVIWHPEWQSSYRELVNQITRRFKPEQIPYMSLGALRFQPEQRHMMRDRFGLSSWVTQAEVHPSSDGKLRYDQDLRKQMFDHIIKSFKQHDSRWNIFLCMETPETWLKTVSAMPKSIDGLEDLFDHRITRTYNQSL